MARAGTRGAFAGTHRRTRSDWALVALAAFVFAPTHLGPAGVTDRVLVGFLTVFLAVGLILEWIRIPRSVGGMSAGKLLSAAAAVTFVLGFNILIASLGAGRQFGYRDYFELARYPIYGIFALVVTRSLMRSPSAVSRVADLVALMVPLLACLAFVTVSLDLPGGAFFSSLYSDAKTSFRSLGDARISVPFENPNQLGAASVLSFVWAVAFRSRLTRYTVWFAPAAVLLSGSRGAWAGLVVAAGAYAILLISPWLRRRLSRTLVASLAAVGVLVIVVFSIQQLSETSRIGRTVQLVETRTIDSDRNLEGRVIVATRAISLWMERPVLGQGPQKSAQVDALDAIDNQYVSILVRHGIVGSVLIGLFYIRALRGLQPSMLLRKNPRLLVYVLATSIVLIPATHLDAFRFWVFWFILLASIVRMPLRSNKSLQAMGDIR